MDISSFKCPVPPEQRPLNEYQALKESWFFGWVTLTRWQYITKLIWVWAGAWVVTGPVAAASFAPMKYPGYFLLSSAAGAGFLLGLAVLRLYLGWYYVRDRLYNQIIVYEESGWYDGQSWTKPPEILTQDRLIVTHQIKPIFQRLHRTWAIIGIFILAGTLSWYLL